MNNSIDILEPYKLTEQLTLSNRIIMAPMTRVKADDENNPTDAMVQYYAKRADVGLIVTEGTIISPDATGYLNTPGIYTDKQIEGWKRVTDAVHNNQGKIFSQIWHVGRASHRTFLNDRLPISASATTMTGRIWRTEDLQYGASREATQDEIKALIQSYANAAANAIKAGFDGVEIHAANGYLIDQFLHYHTNLRDDQYGGAAENMSRFAEEIVKACGDAIGYSRVGIRLSPGGYMNEIEGDIRDQAVFKHLLSTLNNLPIAYVHTGNFDDSVRFEALGNITMTDFLRQHYHGTLIACGGYNDKTAKQGVSDNQFDLVAIGRPVIANPDFIAKLKSNTPLDIYDASMLKNLN